MDRVGQIANPFDDQQREIVVVSNVVHAATIP